MCVQMFILCREVRRIPIIVIGLLSYLSAYSNGTKCKEVPSGYEVFGFGRQRVLFVTLTLQNCVTDDARVLRDFMRRCNRMWADGIRTKHKFRSLGISGVIKKECTYHVVKRICFRSIIISYYC